MFNDLLKEVSDKKKIAVPAKNVQVIQNTSPNVVKNLPQKKEED